MMDEVACRACGKGGEWAIFSDGQGAFEFRHGCGHIVKPNIAEPPILADRQDPEPIDMRFLI